jgi:hypothetical protein
MADRRIIIDIAAHDFFRLLIASRKHTRAHRPLDRCAG